MRIITVNGPPGSGKSFTRQIIQQSAREAPGFPTLYVDLERLPVPGPVELGRALVSGMGRSSGTMPQLDPAGIRPRVLVNWLVAEVLAANGDWWWILDGLSSPAVPQATHDLILDIAASVESTSLRLVLLDFNGSLPAGLTPLAWREELRPIGEQEVREFLSGLLIEQGNRVDPAELDDLTRSLLEGLPADASRLGALSARVSGLAAGLASSSPAAPYQPGAAR